VLRKHISKHLQHSRLIVPTNLKQFLGSSTTNFPLCKVGRTSLNIV